MTSTDAPPAKLPLAIRKSNLLRNLNASLVSSGLWKSQVIEEFKKFATQVKTHRHIHYPQDWARLLEEAGTERIHFTENPGEAMASWMKDALDQIKYQTKDGSDEMLVEGINEAAPSHIVRHLTLQDDSISGTYGCELSDGKLYLVFKSASAAPGYFGSNAHKTLEDLQSKL
ncbi:hypothetical protein P7C70_g6237, partial [Phenoliferia sp. Uapishka_3]